MKNYISLQSPVPWCLGSASLLLVVYHVRYLLFVNYGSLADRSLWIDAFYFLSGLGHQAFGVFFVIQAYLLAGSIQRLGSYRAVLMAKSASTYACLLPVLLLGIVLDGTGSRYLNDTGLYTAFPDFAVLSLDASTLLGQLVMAQPFFVPTFGTNGVLWVLAFEWWYSCIFLLLAAQLRRRRWLGLTLIALLVAAALVSFPSDFITWGLIWLMGVMVAQPGVRAVPLRLAVPLFLVALLLSRYMESQTAILNGPHGLVFSCLKNLSFAAGFSLLLLAMQRKSAELVPDFSTAVFFGHFPLMMFIVALGARWQPLKQAPGAASLLWFVLATVAIYGCTWALYRALWRFAQARRLLR